MYETTSTLGNGADIVYLVTFKIDHGMTGKIRLDNKKNRKNVRVDYASARLIMFWYDSLEAAPTCWLTTSPLLKRISVGMLKTLYLEANSPASSTLTLTNFTLPSYSPARSSTTGLTILHGPHHSAQKSTNTGMEEFMTSTSQDRASET